MNDPRVTDGKLRSEKIGELYAMVAELVADWKTEDLLVALEEADVPNGPATGLNDLADDPHLKAVGAFQTYDHPTEGCIRLTTPSVKFAETPQQVRTLPRHLGEDSVALLIEAGYSDLEIADFMDEGVSVDGRPDMARSAAE